MTWFWTCDAFLSINMCYCQTEWDSPKSLLDASQVWSHLQNFLEKYVFLSSLYRMYKNTHTHVLCCRLSSLSVCSLSYCVLASAVQGPQGMIKAGSLKWLFSSHACVIILRYIRNAVVFFLLTWLVWRGACYSRQVTGSSRKTGNFTLPDIVYRKIYLEPDFLCRSFHFISFYRGFNWITPCASLKKNGTANYDKSLKKNALLTLHMCE